VYRFYKKTLVLVVAFLAFFMLSPAILAATADKTSINITLPQNGDSVLQSNVQITGTAPDSTLINIVITDTDTSKALVAHQNNGQVEGSVTSDDNGNWVYTPQQQLVPGQFSVQASYTNPQQQTINSPAIKFTIITATGASEILSNDTRRTFLAAGIIVVISVLSIIIHLNHRRRKRAYGEDEESSVNRPRRRLKNTDYVDEDKVEEPDQETKNDEDASSPMFLRTFRGQRYRAQQDAKLKALREETEKIENQLGAAAEQLEEANEKVVKLEEQIGRPVNPMVDSEDGPKDKAKK